MRWVGVGTYKLDLWLDDYDERGGLSHAVTKTLQEDPQLKPHLRHITRIAEELLRLCEDEGRSKMIDNLHNPDRGTLILRITVNNRQQPDWLRPKPSC